MLCCTDFCKRVPRDPQAPLADHCETLPHYTVGIQVCFRIICPIAIAQQGTDYKITYVILSVCLQTLLRLQFWFDSDEILHSDLRPKK